MTEGAAQYSDWGEMVCNSEHNNDGDGDCDDDDDEDASMSESE